MTATWEVVAEEFTNEDAIVAVTDRLPVPGGFLYRVTQINDSHSGNFSMPATIAIAFVPRAA